MKIDIVELLKNMGIRYVCFRIWYEVLRRSGWMRRQFPTISVKPGADCVDKFKIDKKRYFYMGKPSVPHTENDKAVLSKEYQNILAGKYPFFSGIDLEVGHEEWLRNPKSGYCYDPHKHWTEIPDIDPAAGDIKFIWEKARYSWVYTLIRSDMICGTDSFDFISSSILSFVRHAPVNCGPHWRCGQEIAVRVINWLMVLQFYHEAIIARLGDNEIEEIITSLHEQMTHVYAHRQFARIAVRNNHAISEALGLFIVGMMCPYFKNSARWKKDGFAALQKEALYQIYPDGSYLQHSFNYQRVIVQQYTLALVLSKVDGTRFNKKVMDRLGRLLDFMQTMQIEACGMLPNYGANDGALLYPFGRGKYRDYRPQLNAFHRALYGSNCYPAGAWYDDSEWLFGENETTHIKNPAPVRAFREGGYYVLRSGQIFVMVRCASYKNRPAQADQQHVDIWYKGVNILHDCGTFTYDMSDELFGYFAGTSSHNTVKIGEHDQMARGPRFIWYKWPQCVAAQISDKDRELFFGGISKVYKQLQKGGVEHTREIVIRKGDGSIEITDRMNPAYNGAVQLWHHTIENKDLFTMIATDDKDNPIEAVAENAFYSNTYGVYSKSRQIQIPLVHGYVKTVIQCKGST